VEYLYILYRVYPENAKGKDFNQLSSGNSNTVLVFDWNGHPVLQYNLDCMVNLIYYDEQQHRFYASKSPQKKKLFILSYKMLVGKKN
jgi:hypothetical protein